MNGWSNVSARHRSKGRAVCYQVPTAEVYANAAAVVEGVKPSYLLDFGFSSVDSIALWLNKIRAVVWPDCQLSILNIENQLFLVNVHRLRRHLLDVISGQSCCQVIVNVSFTLKHPEIIPNYEGQLAIRGCAQFVYDHIKSSDDTQFDIQPPACMNRTTLYGVLLGYPVIYWYNDDITSAGSCLSMVPLLIFTASISMDLNGVTSDCDIYSFSLPEALQSECQKSIELWRSQLFFGFGECRQNTTAKLKSLRCNSKTEVKSAVCL